MPHSGFFVVAIEGLQISEPLDRGDCVRDTFWLTNDASVVRELLPSGFERVAGSLEVNSLTERDRLVAYGRPDVSGVADHKDANILLLSQLAEVGMFLTHLWIDRDHAARMELGFLGWQSRITRNFFPASITTSGGGQGTVSLSREELRTVRHRFASRAGTVRHHVQPLAIAGIDRRQRGLYFVQGARQAHDLGVKVATYCTALEALFGTDTSELTHRLAERIACFLEADPGDRLQVYRQVKEAYSVRSKVVHGAAARINEDDLRSAAEMVDGLTRRVFRRIYEDDQTFEWFSKPTQKGDDAEFLRMVLGGAVPGSYRGGEGPDGAVVASADPEIGGPLEVP